MARFLSLGQLPPLSINHASSVFQGIFSTPLGSYLSLRSGLALQLRRLSMARVFTEELKQGSLLPSRVWSCPTPTLTHVGVSNN